MLSNYWKITLRNFFKHRTYTLINLIGLTAGFSSCLLAFLYVHHEYSYDRFHEGYDRVYRVVSHYRSQFYPVLGFPNYNNADANSQLEKVTYLQEIPAVEQVAQFVVTGELENYATYGEQTFVQKNILFTNTGPAFLDLFSWDFLAGSSSSSFANQNSAVLTETTARRYFGEGYLETAIGQTIRLDSTDYQVTGVIDNIPDVSHFSFEMALNPARIPYWGAYTYLRTNDRVDDDRLAEQITNAFNRQNPLRIDDPLVHGEQVQRLADIHLHSDVLYELKPPGDARYLYLFAFIGTLVLLITLMTYLNLSVAVYGSRNKEVGLRKTLGAQSGGIRWQFWLESLFFATFSWLLSLLVIDAAIPWFNQLMGLKLTNLYVERLRFAVLPVGLVLFTSLVASAYPVLILASQRVSWLFKPKQSPGHHLALRRTLVVSQFAFVIGLVGVTYFINQQLRFVQQKDLGFVREGVVQIPLDDPAAYQRLKQRLLRYPTVSHVGAGLLPGSEAFNNTDYQPEGVDVVLDDAHTLYLDVDYLKTLGISAPALAQADLPNAPGELFFINETAARQFGWDEQSAIGKTVLLEPLWENEEFGRGVPKKVAGVLPDIHFFSLQQAVGPVFYQVYQEPTWLYQMVVRFDATQVADVLPILAREYQEVVSDEPFSYEFLTERLAKLYEQERHITQLTLIMSGIAIVLALLGLMGLVAYLTQLRTKEIGVRKVLGASTGQVLLLLNREFVIGVVLATLIASPITFIIAQRWLSDFAYRVDVNLVALVGIGALVVSITVLSVSLRSLRVARANPVDALRDE